MQADLNPSLGLPSLPQSLTLTAWIQYLPYPKSLHAWAMEDRSLRLQGALLLLAFSSSFATACKACRGKSWRVGIVTVQFWLCLKQQITRIKTPFFFSSFSVNREFREFILGCYFKAVNGLCADTHNMYSSGFA